MCKRNYIVFARCAHEAWGSEVLLCPRAKNAGDRLCKDWQSIETKANGACRECRHDKTSDYQPREVVEKWRAQSKNIEDDLVLARKRNKHNPLYDIMDEEDYLNHDDETYKEMTEAKTRKRHDELSGTLVKAGEGSDSEYDSGSDLYPPPEYSAPPSYSSRSSVSSKSKYPPQSRSSKRGSYEKKSRSSSSSSTSRSSHQDRGRSVTTRPRRRLTLRD